MLGHLTTVEREQLLRVAKGFKPTAPTPLPLIPRADRDGDLPLSFAQQRLWFLAQLDGGSLAYHISASVRLQGAVDAAALRWALDRVVARHEALRTTFAVVDGEPIQRIAPAATSRCALTEHDLCGRMDADAALARLIQAEAGARFDLTMGPLLRGQLIRLTKDEWVLLLTLHHIVADGWSMGILTRELSTLYAAYRRGSEDPLAPLAVQYADYAQWQRQSMMGAALQRQTRYWSETLAGAPPRLELPTDYARPAQQDHHGGFAEVVLDAALTTALKAFGHRHGATLYMTLLAGWGMLLARLSRQPEVVIGTPTANRGRVELEGVIGLFVNTLAIRLDLSDRPSGITFIERVQAQTVAAQHHQDLPFEQVVELVQPERSLAHTPVFQAMFGWQNMPAVALTLPGVVLRPVRASADRWAKVDLTLTLQESAATITGGVEYAAALFTRRTIERWIGYFECLLRGLVADEACPVTQLPILSAAEHAQVVHGWNQTVQADPDGCVHALIEAQATRQPDAVAVVAGDARLSYDVLNRSANRIAHGLRARGVGPEQRVAVCVEGGLDRVMALLAALKAGGTYVPLDPTAPEARLRDLVADSAPTVVLVDRSLRARFATAPSGTTVVDLVAAGAEDDRATAGSLSRDAAERNLSPAVVGVGSDTAAYVIYTSGSTGIPKGVVVTHGALVARLSGVQASLQVTAADRMPTISAPAFDIALLELLLPLVCGGQCRVTDARRTRELDYLATEIESATVVNAVASLMDAWRRTVAGCDTRGRYPALRTLLVGGEAVSHRLWTELRTTFPHAQVVETYGPTEATLYCTSWAGDGDDGRVAPIGQPLANTQLYVLDGHGAPVPVGVTGELYIGGASVARGYWQRPVLTAERFVPDPFGAVPGGRLYRTGDLGRWRADGTIAFVGRADFQVKIRGFRIELGEIEARLVMHPQIAEAVVVARTDGDGEPRLVAYYTLRAGDEPLSAEVVRSHLAAMLPEYMVPAAYVRVEQWPMTATGKLDRQALPAPDGTAYGVAAYEPPQGETERRLAAIWAELLHVEQVGRHDSFFVLGGHSLLAARAVGLLNQSGIDVSAVDLFAHPTIASLAANHERRRAASPDKAICLKTGSGAPIFMTHCGNGTLGYVGNVAAHLDDRASVYGLPPRGLRGGPFYTVESMAARMVDMIRAVQPAGPYRIAGWSLGGIIAYEIANQLIGADEQVQFLGLFDTQYIGRPGRPPDSLLRPLDETPVLLSLVDVEAAEDVDAQANAQRLRSMAADITFDALVDECERVSLKPSFLAGLNATQIKQLLAIIHAATLANYRYCAKPLPIPLHLFATEEEQTPASWEAVVPKHLLRVIPVRGSHRSMMRPPNVEELGRLVSAAVHDAGASEMDVPETRYSPAVLLQQGRSDVAPLFCLPGAGSPVTNFVDLLATMDPSRPIHGLQPRGLDGRLLPHSTVAAAASCYLHAINEVRPYGPLSLLGHSFGGWLAFELALRLTDMGRDVVSLTIVDSRAPTDDAGARECTAPEIAMEWIHIYEQSLDRSLRIDPDDLDVSESEQLQLVHRRLVEERMLGSHSRSDALRGPLRTFAAARRTCYTPDRPYRGRTTFVTVDNPTLDGPANRSHHDDLARAWKGLAPELVVVHAPGNHVTVLKPPHVAFLSTLIEASMR